VTPLRLAAGTTAGRNRLAATIASRSKAERRRRYFLRKGSIKIALF
jgi:hypothetical protein